MLHLNAKGNGRLGYHISEIIRNAHPEEKTLNVFIDQWHLAAATADSAAYFGAFYNEHSIFQGTDGGEYWTAGEFQSLGRSLLPKRKRLDLRGLRTPLVQKRKHPMVQ